MGKEGKIFFRRSTLLRITQKLGWEGRQDFFRHATFLRITQMLGLIQDQGRTQLPRLLAGTNCTFSTFSHTRRSIRKTLASSKFQTNHENQTIFHKSAARLQKVIVPALRQNATASQ